MRATFASGFSDTGVNERLGRIQSDVDTGLRVHIDDLDTGLHAHVTAVDSGVVEKTLQGMANRLWNADMAEMADSGTATRRTPLQAIRFNRNKWTIAAGTLSVKKEDDTAESWSSAVTSSPGDPHIESDPA